MKLHVTHRLLRLAAWLALLAAGRGPGMSQAQRSREPVTLNFVNADIEAVARTMAAITGRNIVVDPRVKGTINLSTERPVSPHGGLQPVPRGAAPVGLHRGGIGRLAQAGARGRRQAAGRPGLGRPRPLAGNQIVTQIFRLNYEPAANLVPILRPLISPNNTINVNPGNNSLVITDYADNLQRLARIIAALDVSNATDVEVIPLRHALAADLAPVVQRLVDSSGAGARGAPGQGQADTSFRTTVIAEPRSNALLVRAANPARLNLVRSLVDKLDQPASQNAGRQHLRRLPEERRGRASWPSRLRAAMAATTGARARPAAACATGGAQPAASSRTGAARGAARQPARRPTPTQPSAQPSTGGQIQADPATNSLIITAAEPQYRQLRAVIDRLDARRAQVYVESLIAEVNADKAAEFGIQWQNAARATRATSNVGVLGTNFSHRRHQHHHAGDRALASGTATPSSGAQLRRGDATSTASTCWASWRASWRPTATATCCPRPTC